MSKNLVIVDYGMGNINSIKRKLERLGSDVIVSSNADEVLNASKIILPGVGHFRNAMDNLRSKNLIQALNEAVLVKKTPVLGICLGMQLMARHSEEGDCEGLGWFDASVVRFNVNNTLKYKVPHIGWNNVGIYKDSPLMKGVDESLFFYFVHSYYMVCNHQEDVLNQSIYEAPFVSAISKENVFGVQYHPEKSQQAGEIILKNFIKI